MNVFTRPSALLLAVLSSCLAASGASALTLTSTAAGFASTATFNCETEFNIFEIEVLFNSPAGCRRQGVVEFALGGLGLTSVSSATVTLFDGGVGNMEGSFFAVDLYGYTGDGQVTSGDYNVGAYIGPATWSRYGLLEGQFAIDVTDYVNAQLALGALGWARRRHSSHVTR